MPKPGSEYEDLVAEVVAAIGQAQGLETVELEVRHSVKGRTMIHEVDVWWRFRAGDLDRTVWFTCKDWKKGVDNEAVWAFLGKLNDIDPPPHGVFVVRNRLQSGAITAAGANGISAWELRPPTERDLKGRVLTIEIDLAVSLPERELEIEHVDPNPAAGVVTETRSGWSDDIRVVLQDGTDIGALSEAMNEMMPVAPLGEETDWEQTVRTFDPPARLVHEGDATRPVSALIMKTRWHVNRSQIRVGGPEKILLIINDALGTGTSVIDHHMRVISGEVARQALGPGWVAAPEACTEHDSE